MYVRCVDDCSRQLVIEGFDLPSDSEDPGYSFARSVEGLEPLGRREVVPLEGVADKMSGRDSEWPGELPRAFLDSLWEGFEDG